MIWQHLRPWLDALVFSSVWLAATAALLLTASSLAMGTATNPLLVGLAFFGTIVIYNVDRLRDLPRDRHTVPERSAFVSHHKSALVALVAVAGIASGALASLAGARVAWVLLPVLVIGLFHRRLKRFEWAKTTYITTAWVCVVVGLPAWFAREATHLLWVVAIIATAITANAIASNVRDREAAAARLGLGRALAIARGSAFLGTIVAVLAPAPAQALIPIPAATGLVLMAFRPTERFGLLAVDGALLIGALVSIPLSYALA